MREVVKETGNLKENQVRLACGIERLRLEMTRVTNSKVLKEQIAKAQLSLP